MANCIVCNTPNVNRQPGPGDSFQYDCPRCGFFLLSHGANSALPTLLAQSSIRSSLMSHTLQKMQASNQTRIWVIRA
jgi:hypothetical protein